MECSLKQLVSDEIKSVKLNGRNDEENNVGKNEKLNNPETNLNVKIESIEAKITSIKNEFSRLELRISGDKIIDINKVRGTDKTLNLTFSEVVKMNNVKDMNNENGLEILKMKNNNAVKSVSANNLVTCHGNATVIAGVRDAHVSILSKSV